ncbi:hypothetical protein ACFQU7_42910 [Pseudoroseomonas wenyumeiae]
MRSLAEVNQQGRIDFGYRLDFHRLMAVRKRRSGPCSKPAYTVDLQKKTDVMVGSRSAPIGTPPGGQHSF